MNKKIIVAVLIFFVMLIVILVADMKHDFVQMELSNLPMVDNGELSVLSANIGNSNLRCKKYFWKLCITEVENNIKQNINVLEPDIVILQELLPYEVCADHPTDNSEIVCSQYSPDDHQAARLLPDQYTIVCDNNSHMQCIGVNNRIGEVDSCSPGNLCFNGRTVEPVEGCTPNFTVFAISVITKDENVFDIVNVHLNSRDSYCRTATFEKIFLQTPENSIIKNHDVIIAGDFNIDLFRGQKNEVEEIVELVNSGWDGSILTIHSPINPPAEPPITFRLGFITKTLDYCYSNFLDGEMLILGETDGTTRLDGGWGMDHLALYGVFELLEKP